MATARLARLWAGGEIGWARDAAVATALLAELCTIKSIVAQAATGGKSGRDWPSAPFDQLFPLLAQTMRRGAAPDDDLDRKAVQVARGFEMLRLRGADA